MKKKRESFHNGYTICTTDFSTSCLVIIEERQIQRNRGRCECYQRIGKMKAFHGVAISNLTKLKPLFWEEGKQTTIFFKGSPQNCSGKNL